MFPFPCAPGGGQSSLCRRRRRRVRRRGESADYYHTIADWADASRIPSHPAGGEPLLPCDPLPDDCDERFSTRLLAFSHGSCSSACVAVRRFFGCTTSSLRMKVFASSLTPSHSSPSCKNARRVRDRAQRTGKQQ